VHGLRPSPLTGTPSNSGTLSRDVPGMTAYSFAAGCATPERIRKERHLCENFSSYLWGCC
jgi:hypothetical protein